jgi:hypothetical protein
MANAVTMTAPQKEEITVEGELVTKGSNEHIALSQDFDAGKKYMFELAAKNPERDLPVWDMRANRPHAHKEYKPFQNIVFTSQVVWNNRRRMIRYYDGCDSIFVDKQPREKELIDQLIRQSKKRNFLEGKFGCYGDERMLLLYLNICSWNAESIFRTRTADAIFIPVNQEKKAEADSIKLDKTEKALDLAKKATSIKMRIHAQYLGIPLEDYDSGNDLTDEQIRTEYRKEALRNSEKFIESYGNKSIEVKYYIDSALSKGTISNKLNANKASWQSGSEICDISGLKTQEAIAQRLYEFSQTEDGAEFLIQLKAVNE